MNTKHTVDQDSRFPYEDIVNTQWPRPDTDAADGTLHTSRECRSSKAADALSPGNSVHATTHVPAQSCREKMSLNDRAKIFAPFAALKGFEEALEERARRLL